MDKPKHYILDIMDCDKAPLQSIDDVSRYLQEVIKYLGLISVGPVSYYQFPAIGHKDNNGITASLILTTSLISIHTYPRERVCYIDLFACTDYSQDDFLSFTKTWFRGKSCLMKPVTRLKYINPYNGDYKDRRKIVNYHLGLDTDSDPDVNNYGLMY